MSHGLEQLAGEVLRGADAGGAERQLTRLRTRQRDEFGDALRGHVVVEGKDVGREHRLRDRNDILHGVERHLVVEARIDRELRQRCQQERIAVGRCLGDAIAGNVGAGAGNVLDHHRLAPRLRELVSDHPRNEIGGPGRRETHDDPDRLVRIARLRDRVACRPEERQRSKQGGNDMHRYSPFGLTTRMITARSAAR